MLGLFGCLYEIVQQRLTMTQALVIIVAGLFGGCIFGRALSFPSAKMHENPSVEKDIQSTANQKQDNICCVPASWQALMYVDTAIVVVNPVTVYSYSNGTATIAYSLRQKKVYLWIHEVKQNPFIPEPEASNTTMLFDFNTGIQYQVAYGRCEKSKLATDMPHQCIPDSAKILSNGKVGYGNTSVTTYQFISQTGLPFQMTATVFKHATSIGMPTVCDPIHIEYITPPSSTGNEIVYGLSMMDMGAIQDQTVFEVPSECL